ncbi:MAG: RNA-binding protein [Holosporaceae bacterium]|jgi:hypothetical protein|nr:RNA-binding protein [Holosporaceae bacterium]
MNKAVLCVCFLASLDVNSMGRALDHREEKRPAVAHTGAQLHVTNVPLNISETTLQRCLAECCSRVTNCGVESVIGSITVELLRTASGESRGRAEVTVSDNAFPILKFLNCCKFEIGGRVIHVLPREQSAPVEPEEDVDVRDDRLNRRGEACSSHGARPPKSRRQNLARTGKHATIWLGFPRVNSVDGIDDPDGQS